jgi:hypothetical protein
MTERLEQYLYKKYPELFQNHNKSMKETCMCWGCSCGDGWFFLLDKLCCAITRHIEKQHRTVEYYDDFEKEMEKEITDTKNVMRPDWAYTKIDQVYFDQVKEKFGSLRVYFTGGDRIIDTMVNFAEQLSESICEECGKFDYSIGRTTKGWLRNVCKECVEKWDDDREWKQYNTELESIFKAAMEDKELNKNQKIDLAFKKLEELRLRDKNETSGN